MRRVKISLILIGKMWKGSKKKIENYFSYKFFIYIFAYIKTFAYLCITNGVASTLVVEHH